MANFEIYRSKQNERHYVAIRADSDHANAAGVRGSDTLAFLTLVADDGEPRIAFDPDEARSRIARDGFYAFVVTVEPREHID